MRKIWTIGLAFGVVIGIASCRSAQHKQMNEPLALPLADVIERTVPIRGTFVGQTYGREDITLQARVNGFLRQINFTEGRPVHKGQLLYVIEPAPLESQQREAEAALASAQASLTQARSNYNRVVPLAAASALSQSDLDNATATLHSAEASVRSAKAALKYASTELGYTRVVSPVNGVIGRTLARVGDYVGLQSQIPVLNTVSQIDSIRVRFFLPEALYLELTQSGKKPSFHDIRLLLSDNKSYPQAGVFNFIGRAVTPTTASLEVQVTFANPDSLLRPGQFARIEATLDSIPNALLIPQQSVIETQGLYTVYAVDAQGKVSQRSITPGNTYGTLWEIKSGLKPGERVVTEGFHKIRNGMTVVAAKQ